ncbi:MAG: hypothetical protein ACKPKO_25250 [Candidatus Fonsibacter sp.]
MKTLFKKERAYNISAELQVGFLVRTAEQRMSALESHAESTQAESDENARLLSGSISAVYTLEQEYESLKHVASSPKDEILNYRRAHNTLQTALQERTQENES